MSVSHTSPLAPARFAKSNARSPDPAATVEHPLALAHPGERHRESLPQPVQAADIKSFIRSYRDATEEKMPPTREAFSASSMRWYPKWV